MTAVFKIHIFNKTKNKKNKNNKIKNNKTKDKANNNYRRATDEELFYMIIIARARTRYQRRSHMHKFTSKKS